MTNEKSYESVVHFQSYGFCHLALRLTISQITESISTMRCGRAKVYLSSIRAYHPIPCDSFLNEKYLLHTLTSSNTQRGNISRACSIPSSMLPRGNTSNFNRYSCPSISYPSRAISARLLASEPNSLLFKSCGP